MRISIPLDLSSRSFTPLPRFIRARRSTPLLAPSLVFSPRVSAYAAHEGFFVYKIYRIFLTPHSFSVTLFTQRGERVEPGEREREPKFSGLVSTTADRKPIAGAAKCLLSAAFGGAQMESRWVHYFGVCRTVRRQSVGLPSVVSSLFSISPARGQYHAAPTCAKHPSAAFTTAW